MHNIDRTNMESNYGEYPTGEFEYEFEGDPEGETYGGTYGETDGETDGEYDVQESPFSEAEEMALASELLAVSSEAELDQFLGKLFKKAGRAVGKFVKSPVGRALGGALKGVARKALPVLGSAVGNVFLPGVGGAVGGKLASAAGRWFGLELEGLSDEDQEFETARGIVRLAGAAASHAAQAPQGVAPAMVAQSALTEAARQHAPGLLRNTQAGGRPRPCPHKASGRWVRRGKSIILIGA